MRVEVFLEHELFFLYGSWCPRATRGAFFFFCKSPAETSPHSLQYPKEIEFLARKSVVLKIPFGIVVSKHHAARVLLPRLNGRYSTEHNPRALCSFPVCGYVRHACVCARGSRYEWSRLHEMHEDGDEGGDTRPQGSSRARGRLEEPARQEAPRSRGGRPNPRGHVGIRPRGVRSCIRDLAFSRALTVIRQVYVFRLAESTFDRDLGFGCKRTPFRFACAPDQPAPSLCSVDSFADLR